VIITDPRIVRQLVSTFESDWEETDSGKQEIEEMERKEDKKKKKKKKE
jgi:hypothetical protein